MHVLKSFQKKPEVHLTNISFMVYAFGLKHMGIQNQNTPESLLTAFFEISMSFSIDNSFRTTHLIDASIYHSCSFSQLEPYPEVSYFGTKPDIQISERFFFFFFCI